MASYDVASNICQALPRGRLGTFRRRGGASQIIPSTSSTRLLNPRFLSSTISCDVASNICQALFEPLCLDLNDILSRSEQRLPGRTTRRFKEFLKHRNLQLNFPKPGVLTLSEMGQPFPFGGADGKAPAGPVRYCSKYPSAHSDPSFLDLNGILWRGEHYLPVSKAWHTLPVARHPTPSGLADIARHIIRRKRAWQI